MLRLAETICLDVVDSTNSYALEHFESFGDGTLILAKRQSAGRGRKGRVWASPSDVNIYASLILKGFSFLPAQASWIASLATLEILRGCAPRLDFSVKWPNDILCGDRKIAGVLCEVKRSSGGPEGIVIGIGVNINMEPKDLRRLDKPACSILSETGRPVKDVDGLAHALGEEAMRLYEFAKDEGIERLFELWRTESLPKGSHVEAVMDDGSSIHGQIENFQIDGSLVLRTATGRRKISSGDVSLKAPRQPELRLF